MSVCSAWGNYQGTYTVRKSIPALRRSHDLRHEDFAIAIKMVAVGKLLETVIKFCIEIFENLLMCFPLGNLKLR